MAQDVDARQMQRRLIFAAAIAATAAAAAAAALAVAATVAVTAAASTSAAAAAAAVVTVTGSLTNRQQWQCALQSTFSTSRLSYYCWHCMALRVPITCIGCPSPQPQ